MLRVGRYFSRSESFTSQLSGMPENRLNRTASIYYDGRPANQNGYENAECWIVNCQVEDRYVSLYFVRLLKYRKMEKLYHRVEVQ